MNESACVVFGILMLSKVLSCATLSTQFKLVPTEYGKFELRPISGKAEPVARKKATPKNPAQTQHTSKRRNNKRNLGKYKKVGPYTLALTMDAQVRMGTLATIRDFIWQHWRTPSLAYATVTFYSKEGEPSTYYYFIEPDNTNSWRITVEINRLTVDRGGSKLTRHQIDTFVVYTVERVEGEGRTRIVIPDSAVREGRSYRMRFIDQQGNVRNEI
jgi:hypothetical protein